jgi:hypothetical protein
MCACLQLLAVNTPKRRDVPVHALILKTLVLCLNSTGPFFCMPIIASHFLSGSLCHAPSPLIGLFPHCLLEMLQAVSESTAAIMQTALKHCVFFYNTLNMMYLFETEQQFTVEYLVLIDFTRDHK